MYRWSKRLLLLSLFIALVGLNILTLVSGVVFTALSTAVQQVTRLDIPLSKLRRERDQLRRQEVRQQAAVRHLRRRAIRRTQRLAAYQVVEAGSAYLPVVGTAVVVGGTLWELRQLCAGLQDLAEMQEAFALAPEADEAGILEQVCNPELPKWNLSWEAFPGLAGLFGEEDGEDAATVELPAIEGQQKR